MRSRRRGSGRRGLEQDAEGRGKSEKKYEDDGDGQRWGEAGGGMWSVCDALALALPDRVAKRISTVVANLVSNLPKCFQDVVNSCKILPTCSTHCARKRSKRVRGTKI